MKKSKILNIFVSLTVVVCLVFTTAYAAFPDVPEDRYNWAVEAINSMADEGIIKGYEDGTFQPEKSISKLEGLVLIARVLGCDASENEIFMDEAKYMYKDIIEDYELSFGENELAYLLLKGVITEEELEVYVGDGNSGTPLMRYEVAMLLTKALDAEDNLPSASALTYADADSVPATAKKYVRYVTEQGLMNGMEDNKFSPNTGVTRAQAAVLLKKLQNKTNYQFRTGTVVEMDTVTSIIRLKDSEGSTISHSILPNVILRYDGERITKAEIASGYNASITYKDAEVYAIDFTPSLIDDYVYGALTSITTKGTMSIGVAVMGENDTEPAAEKTAYKLTDDVVVTVDGEDASVGSLKTGYYVKLNIKSGKVKAIEAEQRQSSVSGTLAGIYFDPVFKIAVTNKSGDTSEYLLKDSATITRNGKSAEASDLTEGDIVSVTLDYGRISKLTATSKTSTKSGVITEILISSKPKLTLTIEGEDVTYPLSATAEFSITGTDGTNTIYDLRTNTVATVTIESDTITKVTTTAATETKTVTGEVVSVTPAANVFQVKYTDPSTGVTQTDSILVNSKTTIIDINGKSQKISALTIGTQVTVYGTIGSGIVAATTVMKLD
ncbi:MAG: S-layer homology domain-containing protein [Clostridia bacterium]|nr:S-layer homology domain-containing protein [Clostridia bacterium]